MACSNHSRYISSDPEFILNYFDHLSSYDSDSDFNDDTANEDEASPTDHSNSLQIKPVLLPLLQLPVLHLIHPLLLILPPTHVCIIYIYINNKYFILLISFLSSVHPFTASPCLTVDMSGKLPVDFNLFFTSEVKKIYTETVRYDEQKLISTEAHLNDNPKRGYGWLRNPMQREK